MDSNRMGTPGWRHAGVPRSRCGSLLLIVAELVVFGSFLALAPTASAASVDTKITSGPSGAIASTSAAFKLQATQSAAKFQCHLDAQKWAACTSPRKYSALSQGRHAFSVRARKGHKIDRSPATRSFTVDTSAPDTLVVAGPTGGSTIGPSPSFSFTGTDTLSPADQLNFQCSIDGDAFSSCSSPEQVGPLTNGSHSFQVRAVDAAQNTDPTPAQRSFTVDSVAPETSIQSGPNDSRDPGGFNGYTEDQSPSFGFSSNEAGSFVCRITSASSSPPFGPCSSPFIPASPLPRDAFYTFEVMAIDQAGNADATPASWHFDVETPITDDLQTAQLAAAILFPDTANKDAIAWCSPNDTILDCPGGTALAPDPNQLSTASSRSAVAAVATGPNSYRYDFTVTHDAHTISPVVLTSFGSNCNLTFNSANGASPHWTIQDSLTIVNSTSANNWHPGGKAIAQQGIISGIEAADYGLAGSFTCLSNPFNTGQMTGAYQAMTDPFRSLCVALGPGYIAPCP
jgi:hypothetical protein